MAPFSESELDWSRIDIQALVEGNGLISIEESGRSECRTWLLSQSYTIATLDCTQGTAAFVDSLESHLRWEKFGYQLKGRRPNLDALNDGFWNVTVPANGGLVFEVIGPEQQLEEDPIWMRGFLVIAQWHTRFHLTFGRRFFTMLVHGTRGRQGGVGEPITAPAMVSPMMPFELS